MEVKSKTEDIEPELPTKILNKTFISILLANTSMLLAMMMGNSLIAKYADFLGAVPAVVGFVTGIFAATSLLFKSISGPAIDSFNRRLILMGATIIMAIAFFGFSISVSIPMMIFFRLLQGIGMAFFGPCCLALASDSLPKDKFGSGIGVYSMGQAAALAVAPSIALWLFGLFGYRATFTIGGCMMIFAALVASMIKNPKRNKKEFHISINNMLAKEAIIPTIILFILALAFTAIGSFLIIYAGVLGVENIGFYFMVYAGTMLFTRPVIGKLTDRLGIVKIIIPAIFCFAISFLIISYATVLWMFLLAAFVASFGFGACQPAIQTLAMKTVNPERRGAASSTVFIAMDTAFFIGPILAGTIVGLFGYTTMWRVTLIPMGIAFIIVIFSRKFIMQVEEAFKERNQN